MSRVLVLRDRDAAKDTARDLARRGHEPLLLPVQEIVATEDPAPRGGYGCIAVTSRNAVPALERHPPPGEFLAVGEATAERLRAIGCDVTYVGGGSAEHLVAPAVAIAARSGGAVLLAVGRPRTSTLEDGLASAGVPFAVWETYETRIRQPSRDEIEAAVGAPAPDAVLLLSVGQAEAFASLHARHRDLFQPTPRLFCLSKRIADALPAELRAFALISPTPETHALFERLSETNLSPTCLAGSAGETKKTG